MLVEHIKVLLERHHSFVRGEDAGRLDAS